MTDFPRITFGMIVLNSEPFLRYNLRALYPFAHEIIVVEGAVESAAPLATADGHSRDGTLETLHRFKAEEDPENKLQIITREGLWDEKDAMSQAYAARATGDYLWQIDSDEFYRADDMQAVIEMLRAVPTITAVSFKMKTFWGSLHYWVDGWFLRRGNDIYHRLFKWGPGYRYVTHRPPTVHNERGQDLRTLHWIDGNTLASKGIFLYHYSLLLPKQVLEKSTYYGKAFPEISGDMDWAENGFMRLKRPFHVHNVYRYPSWLLRYQGDHPAEIQQMWADLQAGQLPFERRPMNDVERLLNSWWYTPARTIVQWLDYPARWLLRLRRLVRRIPQKALYELNRLGFAK
jgi:hypothetical protein